MENASKALIMSASILLAVVIISFGSYLFVKMANYSKTINNQVDEKSISEHNVQFLKYEGKEVTAHDIVTIINLARENNRYYEMDEAISNSAYITVSILSSGGLDQNLVAEKINDKNNEYIEKLLKEKSYDVQGNIKKYFCESVKINQTTKMVEKIIIK